MRLAIISRTRAGCPVSSRSLHTASNASPMRRAVSSSKSDLLRMRQNGSHVRPQGTALLMMIRGGGVLRVRTPPARVRPKPRLYSEFLKSGGGGRNPEKLPRRGPINLVAGARGRFGTRTYATLQSLQACRQNSRRITKFVLLSYRSWSSLAFLMRYWNAPPSGGNS